MNRLDRLTSGLMVLARTAKIAGRLGNQISSHVVHKHYLARVTGHFPSYVSPSSLVSLLPLLSLFLSYFFLIFSDFFY